MGSPLILLKTGVIEVLGIIPKSKKRLLICSAQCKSLILAVVSSFKFVKGKEFSMLSFTSYIFYEEMRQKVTRNFDKSVMKNIDKKYDRLVK